MSEKGNDKQTKKRKEKVLVYDIEKGETTKCFIEALKKHLDDFEFKDFREANEGELPTLSIIAVVRHTSIRFTEALSEVKEQLDKENIKDLKRVFVIYFYVNKSDEGCVHKITQISESGQFDFASIVPINFIGASLLTSYFCSAPKLKTDTEESLQKLKECILSRKKLCVNVYGAVDLLRVKAFIAELHNCISSKIELQAVKPLEEVTNITSPTLICTTGDVEECQEKLKEKDLKRVFFVHIVDVVKRSEIRVMHDSPDDMENTKVIHEEQNTLPVGAGKNNLQNTKNTPCEIHEILDYNGKIVINYALAKQFETFVCT
ncbi:uncharacterized protein LOC132756221 [Ruditapes philippinarum]|uniref:uncharacterized protein LOC132756221 n=1 Tax=Ruditapes philippinarum TaxID=129788 RepID=UPI00295B8DF6|nr:uncharacterized protein LOC132756221 [Ruditapes philippinarum]